MSTNNDQELIDQALIARSRSYSPYSKFAVGAAIRSKSGKIYHGTNVENASYGLTICAERVAIANAISAGDSEFSVVAICVNGAGSPCGACRQVMNEFAPDIRVLIADEQGRLSRELTLGDLLPDAFGPHSL